MNITYNDFLEVEKNKKMNVYYKNEAERWYKCYLIREQIKKYLKACADNSAFVYKTTKPKFRALDKRINKIYKHMNKEILNDPRIECRPGIKQLMLITKKYADADSGINSIEVRNISYTLFKLCKKQHKMYHRYNYLNQIDRFRLEIFKYTRLSLKDFFRCEIDEIYD